MLRAALLSLALALALPAAAQDGPGVEEVISNQLRAFNDGDVLEAWQYASPTIQRLFGTPENFGQMVRQGYPMVWSNRDARFLERQEIAGRLYQKVLLRGPQGALHVLAYEMTLTEDGWRIDGVAILPAPDTGV